MSIITEKEFLSKLYVIQSDNPPSQVLFPKTKPIYDIDLSTRTIEAPPYLSVSKDHKSETIYFRIDRYHDFMDLSLLPCIIQYITPDNVTHWYAVPFCDVISEQDDLKMIIPWNIDGIVTQLKGTVTFSLRFFKVEQEIIDMSDYIDEDAIKNGASKVDIKYNLLYNLTTLPAESRILEGLEVPQGESKFDVAAEAAAYLLQEINKINRSEGIYWELPDTEYTKYPE